MFCFKELRWPAGFTQSPALRTICLSWFGDWTKPDLRKRFAGMRGPAPAILRGDPTACSAAMCPSAFSRQSFAGRLRSGRANGDIGWAISRNTALMDSVEPRPAKPEATPDTARLVVESSLTRLAHATHATHSTRQLNSLSSPDSLE